MAPFAPAPQSATVSPGTRASNHASQERSFASAAAANERASARTSPVRVGRSRRLDDGLRGDASIQRYWPPNENPVARMSNPALAKSDRSTSSLKIETWG